jgi:hypothetical protein
MATLPTDPTSPTYWCDLAAYLRERYYAALAGDRETLIRDRGPDSEQEVRFGNLNLQGLKDELTRAEEACAAANGQVVKRRFAITAGSRRVYVPPRG